MLIAPLLFYLVLTTAGLPVVCLSVYFFKFLNFLLNCFGVPIQSGTNFLLGTHDEELSGFEILFNQEKR